MSLSSYTISPVSDGVITLATIHSDIIRRIIAIDDGKSIKCMSLISQTWHALVVEYLNNQPHIESMHLEGHSISITLKARDLCHFDPKIVVEYNEEGPPTIRFITDADDEEPEFSDEDEPEIQQPTDLRNEEMITLTSTPGNSHWGRRAGRVKHITIRRVDRQSLIDFGRTLARVKVDKLEIINCRQCEERLLMEQLANIIRVHSVDELRSDASLGCGSALSDFLLDISRTLSTLHLTGNCMYVDRYHNLQSLFGISDEIWDRIAEEILKNGMNVKFVCKCGEFKRECAP